MPGTETGSSRDGPLVLAAGGIQSGVEPASAARQIDRGPEPQSPDEVLERLVCWIGMLPGDGLADEDGTGSANQQEEEGQEACRPGIHQRSFPLGFGRGSITWCKRLLAGRSILCRVPQGQRISTRSIVGSSPSPK